MKPPTEFARIGRMNCRKYHSVFALFLYSCLAHHGPVSKARCQAGWAFLYSPCCDLTGTTFLEHLLKVQIALEITRPVLSVSFYVLWGFQTHAFRVYSAVLLLYINYSHRAICLPWESCFCSDPGGRRGCISRSMYPQSCHLNYFNIGNDIIKTCCPNCRNRIEVACIIKYAHLVRVKCIQNICLQTD